MPEGHPTVRPMLQFGLKDEPAARFLRYLIATGKTGDYVTRKLEIVG
jgi:hypothetical protein